MYFDSFILKSILEDLLEYSNAIKFSAIKIENSCRFLKICLGREKMKNKFVKRGRNGEFRKHIQIEKR